MSLEKLQLKQLFDTSPDAVIVLKNDKVFYRNNAAKGFIPAVDGKLTLRDLMIYKSKLRPPCSTSGFVNTVFCSIYYTVVEDLSVFTLQPGYRGRPSHFRNLMNSLYVPIASGLHNIKYAGDVLTDAMKETELAELESYFASMQHSYYSLLNTLDHISILSERDTIGKGTFTEFDIVSVIGYAIENARVVCDEHAPKITYTPGMKKLTIYGDMRRIERMVLEMLSNGLKYTPEDGEVNISFHISDGCLLISVTDNGCGIKSEKLHTVWTRYSSEKDFSDSKAGAGFGLSVIQKIAKQHGGVAMLDSTVGVGTTVTVSLDVLITGEKLEFRSPKVLFNSSDVWPDPIEREQFLAVMADVVKSKWYGSFYIK